MTDHTQQARAASNEGDSLLVVIALVRRLGGDVTLTAKELMEAADLELQRNDPPDFRNAIRYRVRTAPVTIEGEAIVGEVTSG